MIQAAFTTAEVSCPPEHSVGDLYEVIAFSPARLSDNLYKRVALAHFLNSVSDCATEGNFLSVLSLTVHAAYRFLVVGAVKALRGVPLRDRIQNHASVRKGIRIEEL